MPLRSAALGVVAILVCWMSAVESKAQSLFVQDTAALAAKFRPATSPVQPQSDGLIICEAEEFQTSGPGWKAGNWGENYYAATFANSFLSRKAFLGAPEQCETATASITVNVTDAGKYLALVRYEAAYRFETQFRLVIEQNGQVKLDRLYGARRNLKIWPFRQGLKTEVAWDWGAVENVVWEGDDASVDLQPGLAKLTLIADRQEENAARRNVDLVLLTRDTADVQARLEKENYLPLDGLLTQCDDVYLKLHNQADGGAMKLTVPPCTEHSPYWVHQRSWKPKTIAAASGQSTDWIEVGSLLDTLNDGQWNLSAAADEKDAALHYKVEFGLRTPGGSIEPLATFESRSTRLPLAFHADTRYSRKLRRVEDVLYDLLAYLKSHPVEGKPPERTLIFGLTFEPREGDAKYNAAVEEFRRMFALTSRDLSDIARQPRPTGYVDVRGNPLDEALYKRWQAEGIASKIAVVSLGDEISLPRPPANDHSGFHAWLQAQKLTPGDVVPGAGSDWTKVTCSPAPETARSNPALFYYSHRYAHAFGIAAKKKMTDFIRQYLPNAEVGANFSPHHGYHYLGETHKWITLFRERGMTLPWSEDYVWQVPVGTQQMNFINLDLFRSGLKHRPQGKIHYYVMPHWGNTPASWRRQFYGDLAHGMKIVDLFEFRPVQAAYTENHADQPEMYLEIRRSFHELARFEDIIQEGRVRAGSAGLWFSDAGDVWDDNRHPFAAAKRMLYCAIRHQQLPLDFVTEADALDGSLKPYRVIYLTDAHVSRAASETLASWVREGGMLLATAGAGMFDEFDQPNSTLRALLGIDQQQLDIEDGESIRFAKQDLPFAEAIDRVKWAAGAGEDAAGMPVFAVRSRVRPQGATVEATFADGAPAVTRHQPAGAKGEAWYAAFLPGLSYFKPAIPLRPVDRGSTDDSMAHFIPTQFDAVAGRIIGRVAQGAERPVLCSEPLVESTVIESPHGTAIPLINWSAGPVKGLKVTVSLPADRAATLASGRPVQQETVDGRQVFTLDLDVADALLLRK